METYNTTPTVEHAVAYAASGEPKPEVAKTRGRKPGRKASAQKKKIPQRGMGVAQLERLRLQQGTKNMNEMPPLDSRSIQNNFQFQPNTHLALAEPIPNVPVLHGARNYGVPVVAGGGRLSLDQGPVMHKVGHGSGFVGGGSGQVVMNQNRIVVLPDLKTGGVGSSSLVTTLAGTSKELSSMPNMHQSWEVMPHDRCDICFKMKRFHEENIGFHHGVQDKYAQTSPIKGYGVPGTVDHESSLHCIEGTNSFSAKAARSAFYASHPNLTNEVEAVHRNGNSIGRRVPKEYEFFPGKVGRNTSYKEYLEFPAEASVALCGEASCFTTAAYSANAATNSVDLSLKLSL